MSATAQDPSSVTTSPGPNKSVARAVRLLSAFTEATPEWSVSELARAFDMSKSSVSTVLATLAAEDLVERSPRSQRYRLGLRCLEMGYLASSGLLVRDLAFPFLEALHGGGDHIVYLGIPYQGDVLYVDALYPLRRQINVSAQGRRAPLYCTGIGKALLAFLPEDEREAYLAAAPFPAATSNTLTSRSDLEREIDRVRKSGYATDLQEREQGIHCVAAPIRGRDGHALASVSVSAASEVLTEARLADMAGHVVATARDIARKLIQAGIPPTRATPLDTAPDAVSHDPEGR